jgi:hypothetical protein
LKVYDLFSGLGGFSQAFVDRGHNVIRYDNDPQFEEIPHTLIKDILDLQPHDIDDADIILASPPCTHFSVAAVYRHWPKGIPTEATLEQIELVKHTIKIIKEANPEYWILENPRGMLRNVIGRPQKTIPLCAYGKKAYKPTDFWGRFPPIDWKTPLKWQKAPRGSKLGVQGYDNAARSAMIPYDFSMAVCLAVEGNSPQRTISEFM